VLKQHDKHEQAVIKRAGRKHAEDDHGGAWKVAFADFCLALMALFLVLWLMATREQQTLKDVVRELRSQLGEGQDRKIETAGGPRGSLIERFALPGRGASSDAIGPSGAPRPKVSYQSPAELASLSRALATMSADAGLSSNLEAVVTPYGLRVILHDTEREGMFVRGSAIPTERFRRLLRKMGPLFAEMENQMLIIGHTDSLQYSASAESDHAGYSNWNLSSNRAMAARTQLLTGSMNSDSVLQVVGMADRAPLDAANAAAGVNRRIELLILTRNQANSVAAMFGKAGATEPLIDGVDTSIPDANALRQLRDQLGKARGRAEHAN
jgi:chemotaxis protein MotB